MTWAQNWNLHCQTHDFSCIIKSQSSYFWELHSLWSLSCYSLLYCTLLQNLGEVDIQPECRCWKMLMFLFVLLWCSKLIGNPAFFWESICTKFLFSSFFPCHVGSSFQKLFNVFRVSLIHWFLFFYYFLINFWLNHSFKGYWISTNFRASLTNLEEN